MAKITRSNRPSISAEASGDSEGGVLEITGVSRPASRPRLDRSGSAGRGAGAGRLRLGPEVPPDGERKPSSGTHIALPSGPFRDGVPLVTLASGSRHSQGLPLPQPRASASRVPEAWEDGIRVLGAEHVQATRKAVGPGAGPMHSTHRQASAASHDQNGQEPGNLAFPGVDGLAESDAAGRLSESFRPASTACGVSATGTRSGKNVLTPMRLCSWTFRAPRRGDH